MLDPWPRCPSTSPFARGLSRTSRASRQSSLAGSKPRTLRAPSKKQRSHRGLRKHRTAFASAGDIALVGGDRSLDRWLLGNEGVASFRIRVGREISSAALIADGYHARVDGWTSLAVLFGAVGVWLGYPLADPSG